MEARAVYSVIMISEADHIRAISAAGQGGLIGVGSTVEWVSVDLGLHRHRYDIEHECDPDRCRAWELTSGDPPDLPSEPSRSVHLQQHRYMVGGDMWAAFIGSCHRCRTVYLTRPQRVIV